MRAELPPIDQLFKETPKAKAENLLTAETPKKESEEDDQYYALLKALSKKLDQQSEEPKRPTYQEDNSKKEALMGTSYPLISLLNSIIHKELLLELVSDEKSDSSNYRKRRDETLYQDKRRDEEVDTELLTQLITALGSKSSNKRNEVPERKRSSTTEEGFDRFLQVIN